MSQRDLWLGFFLLTLLWTGSHVRADDELLCVYGHSCVFPCSCRAAAEVVIHWTKITSGFVYVHSFYSQRDQLGRQAPAFRGRTSLFGGQIPGGNASLLLGGVRVQDGGRYRCHCSTAGGPTTRNLSVRVHTPVKAVRVHREGNSITCSSSWIYPEPELHWASSPPLLNPSSSSLQTPSNSSLQSQTRVQRTEQQLYNISSSLLLPDGKAAGSYSCTVSTASSSRTATLRSLTQSFSINSIIILSCSASSSSGRSLVWRFNHSQSILSRAGPDAEPAVSEGWRQHVGGLSESGTLTLKDLSELQEGEYTCELSGPQETTLTTTYLRVEGPTGRQICVGLLISTAVLVVLVVSVVLGILLLKARVVKKRKGRSQEVMDRNASHREPAPSV